MELAAVFNPLSETSGSFTASTLQVGSTMIVINKSYVDLIFTFANGDRRLVIANDRRAFQFSDSSVVANGIITWSQENIDYPQTANQLENVVYVEVYSATEKVVETYPSAIQRETLPSLIPYNIGHSTLSYQNSSGSTAARKIVVWPSSYAGVTCAPQTNNLGMGFDHYWMPSEVSVVNPMIDIPGFFSQSTGKTENDATINNSSLASYIPGPFSQPGLTPIDSAIYLNGNYWQCASTINWASATIRTLIDAWIYPTEYTQYILGDDNPAFNQTGLYILLSSIGTIQCSVGNGTTHTALHGNMVVPLNEWTYVAVLIDISASTVSIFINGTLDSQATFTGPIANTTEVLSIGRDTRDNVTSTKWFGGLCNVGIILTDAYGTAWGNNIIQARYQLALQSLNIDYQNAWVNGFEVYAYNLGATAANMMSFSLQNIFNPGGLLFGTTPSIFTPLHKNIQVPGNIGGSIGQLSSSQSQQLQSNFYAPATHYNSEFIYFYIQSLSGTGSLPAYIINVYGYNILGLA